MEQINDLVGYENLKIYQNNEWFKFSLDSVLLPNFATINSKCKNILDLCTGNAPIPLILSTLTDAKIVGVEIQTDVYALACKSINVNNLDKQIKLINDDIANLFDKYESDTFDLITINPPYFKNNEKSYKNSDIHKTLARHEICFDLDITFRLVKKLLKNDGYFAMIHRTERFLEIIELLKKNNLTPKRIQFIYSKSNSDSSLFLIESVKNGGSGIKLLKPQYIHNDDGSYREDILKLFKRGE